MGNEGPLYGIALFMPSIINQVRIYFCLVLGGFDLKTFLAGVARIQRNAGKLTHGTRLHSCMLHNLLC